MLIYWFILYNFSEIKSFSSLNKKSKDLIKIGIFLGLYVIIFYLGTGIATYKENREVTKMTLGLFEGTTSPDNEEMQKAKNYMDGLSAIRNKYYKNYLIVSQSDDLASAESYSSRDSIKKNILLITDALKEVSNSSQASKEAEELTIQTSKDPSFANNQFINTQDFLTINKDRVEHDRRIMEIEKRRLEQLLLVYEFMLKNIDNYTIEGKGSSARVSFTTTEVREAFLELAEKADKYAEDRNILDAEYSKNATSKLQKMGFQGTFEDIIETINK